jgi:hypothetical protein
LQSLRDSHRFRRYRIERRGAKKVRYLTWFARAALQDLRP